MTDLQDKELNRLVHEALGRVSLCWTPRPSDQVFDTAQATAIGEELVRNLKALLVPTGWVTVAQFDDENVEGHPARNARPQFDDSDPNYRAKKETPDERIERVKRFDPFNPTGRDPREHRRDTEAGIKSPLEEIRAGRITDAP